MAEIKVVNYRDDVELENPIAIIGFPSVGLVSSIVTSYITKELKMDIIAGLSSPLLPPYTMVQNTLPYSPVRIYGQKDSNGSERDMIIVTSEVTFKPEECYELVTAIFDLLKKYGVKEVIGMEGVPTTNEGGEILSCCTSDAMKDMVDTMGIKRLEEGLIRGFLGVMLYRAREFGIEMTTLLCPANPALPDPRAAADTLKLIAKVLPELDLDSEPLYKEAEEIEKKVRIQEDKDDDDMSQIYG